jgi:uncharacterized protein YbjT (DUF2867 family)
MTTVLVTGARGATGREVAAQLTARAGVSVLGGSSDPSTVAADGVMPVRLDWGDPSSWPMAVDGVDAIYLARPDIEDAPARVRAFLAAAPRVDNVVLLSELGAERVPPETWVSRVEQAFLAVAPAWTILRPSWFAHVLADERFFLDSIREQRRITLPSAGAGISFVDTRDIAAVAVEALLDPRHVGEAYAVTGPAAVTLEEVAERLGAVVGATVRYADQPVSEAISKLRDAGGEPWLLGVLGDLYERVCSREFATVTDVVERVSGVAPRTLDAFVEEHAAHWRR